MKRLIGCKDISESPHCKPAGRQHNAHESVTVHYKWHPFHGQTLLVVRRQKQNRGDLLFCELANGDVVGVPAWMTEPCCARYRIGRPLISAEALETLYRLLTTVLGGPSSVVDNRPIQEVGHETTNTACGVATQAAAGRYPRADDSPATGIVAGADESASASGAPDQQPSARLQSGGSPWMPN